MDIIRGISQLLSHKGTKIQSFAKNIYNIINQLFVINKPHKSNLSRP